MNFALKKISISFCTACRNRLEHLKLTLPENIRGNIDYPEIKFIILDYASTDGLAEWIKKDFNDYLLSGKLEYYRFEEATFFHRTHSRNLMFKMASTDIVCNVDADNYVGNGFGWFISEQFALKPDLFLTTIDFYHKQKKYNVPGDVLGRLCVRKTDFLAIGGFDERMETYGFEDYDFTNRLEMLGLERKFISDDKYLHYIPHDNNLRYSGETYKNSLKHIYISYEYPWKSSVIYLFKDSICAQVTLINNARANADDIIYAYTEREFIFENSFEDCKWNYGIWKQHENRVYLNFNGSKRLFEVSIQGFLYDVPELRFFEVNDPVLIDRLIHINQGAKNRIIFEENLRNEVIKVNGNLFGRGSVIKNFQNLMIVE